jgi:hypothetical protein
MLSKSHFNEFSREFEERYFSGVFHLRVRCVFSLFRSDSESATEVAIFAMLWKSRVNAFSRKLEKRY